MNKKYLKENNLYEAHKQFMRLCEWSYVPSSLQEDDVEEDPNTAPPMDDPNDGGDMGDGNDIPPMDGNDPNDVPPMNDGEPNEGENDIPPMNDDNSGTPNDAPPLGDDLPPMNDEPPLDEPENDDTVIDVDDITNAQEKVNDKVNTVGKNLGKIDDKIENLMQSIESMISKIESQNQEIETLKNEFTRRNPSPTEKLNMRSLSSYPFNVRPDDYWKEKGDNSNYQAYSDNEEPTSEEYTLTNNDVDDFDEKKMADSFFIDDDLQQDIEKIFKGF